MNGGDLGTELIVDCDVHPMLKRVSDVYPYMPKKWAQHFEGHGARLYARARDRFNHPNHTYRMDALPDSGGPAGSDPKFTLKHHIEQFGLSSVMLLPQESYGATAWGNLAAADVFCTAGNDYLMDKWLTVDDRYTLAITVVPHDPVAAAREIRRAGTQPGVVAVQVLLTGQMMGSTWFDPIYEAACEADLPIAFHQNGGEGCYLNAQGVAGGVPRSYGERHVVLTQVGAANIVDLIVGGTFERFPALRIVMVEWGFSWLPSLLGRMDYLWTSNPESAPALTKLPSAYITEHVTFTTQPLDEVESVKSMNALFRTPGIEKMLLFSSDYPHYDTDDPKYILRRVPPEHRSQICFKNAERTFGSKIFRSRTAS